LFEHNVHCEYLDEYSIYRFDTGADLSNFLIPTRVSVFDQELQPGCNVRGCASPYHIASEDHMFVADIENYTLLIDHSFVSEENSMTASSFNLAGFLRICDPIEDNGVETVADEVNMEMEGCPTYSLSNPPESLSDDMLAKIEDEYESLGTDDGVFSIPVGDVMKVSKLMQIAGIDLDAASGDDDQRATSRYEGAVVIVEIHYLNFKEGHFPNSLPPIYEYRIYKLPTATYKMTSTMTSTKSMT